MLVSVLMLTVKRDVYHPNPDENAQSELDICSSGCATVFILIISLVIICLGSTVIILDSSQSKNSFAIGLVIIAVILFIISCTIVSVRIRDHCVVSS